MISRACSTHYALQALFRPSHALKHRQYGGVRPEKDPLQEQLDEQTRQHHSDAGS